MQHKLSIAGVSALLLVAGAGEARAAPRPEGPWFTDGARRVSAERLGSATRDAAGRALTPVRVRYAPEAPAIDAFIDGTAIVKLVPGAEAALAESGVRAVRPLMPSIGLWLVADTGSGDGLDVAQRLSDGRARARGVREAIPNLYRRAKLHGEPVTPNDPRLPGQWYFDGLGMSEAWGRTQGDPGTSVVVIDSGCDLDHQDLQANMDPGLDVVDGDDDASYRPGDDGEGHGTACAGLIAAATNNGEGIAGGCPECRVRCVRFLSYTVTPVSAIVDAFQFALEVDASVVSNSWGFVEPAPVAKVVEDAINNVFDNGRGGKGALVLFAAGNDDREFTDDEIQAVRGVLTVGAVNHLDEETSFTNRGNALDLVAPTGTLTTDIRGSGGYDPSDYTTTFGGTSSACPVAAGIAGLLVSAAPERTAAELYDVMTRTARSAPFAAPDERGHDPVFGYGIIDPVAALNDLLGVEEPTPTPPPPDTQDDGAAEAAGCACRVGTASEGPRSSVTAGGYGALCAAAIALGWARRRRR